MKSLLSAFIACVGLLVVTTSMSCAHEKYVRKKASENYITRAVETGTFDAISTSGSVDVIYTQTSGERSVVLYAPDNLIDDIEVKVDGGTLKVGMRSSANHVIIGGRGMEVRVSAPAVNRLEASSSGDIKLTNGLKAVGDVEVAAGSSGDVVGGTVSSPGNIILKASSNGDIKFDAVSCAGFRANASSNGDIKIDAVSCTDFRADASSNSDVKIGAVACTDFRADASSCGDVVVGKVSCTDFSANAGSNGDMEVGMVDARNVIASASSAADVKLAGKCENADLSANSNGDIKASRLRVEKRLSKKENSAGSVICGD
ncbi:DUF2807 domain-containing protein [uncultured Muribaculum sp.]|uniref:GIN domain-containing protein n=1 Tax=uncultured Muribaculum sp. TaxID=1918613 RepID=UPI00261D1AE4|nr:DUF2807 domain-containing protein [uncultured Muribaculum sp.]